jgi:predicted aconitase with swiveling domain
VKRKIPARAIVEGTAEGPLVVSREPFSFFGGFDFRTGQVSDPRSDVYGCSLKDTVFAYPRGKGSSSTAGVLLEALRRGSAPAAIINIESEKVLAVGAVVAAVVFDWSLPIVSIPALEFERLRTGELARICDETLSVLPES